MNSIERDTFHRKKGLAFIVGPSTNSYRGPSATFIRALPIVLTIGSLALAALSSAQTNHLNKMIGTVGDSELRGCLTRWYWSISGETPINDWNYDERRGYELGALMVYLSNGRLRSRTNTAWG